MRLARTWLALLVTYGRENKQTSPELHYDNSVLPFIVKLLPGYNISTSGVNPVCLPLPHVENRTVTSLSVNLALTNTATTKH
jgi:hypothetical protein